MTTQDSGDKDHDYVCMKKIRHRKSCKKKKPVVRKVSVKVKRQRSMVKRKPSLPDKRSGRRGSVKKTKSFIVKRKSFKRPQRWSTYIREDERLRQVMMMMMMMVMMMMMRQEQSSWGTLPRVKGIWAQRKYKDLPLPGRSPLRTFSERRITVTRCSFYFEESIIIEGLIFS